MRNAIITGGSGALGQAVVQRFLEDGYRVVVPWISEQERSRLASDHEQAIDEERLVTLEADIAEADGASRVVESAGSVDVLVNGAGGFTGGQPVAETGLDDWDRMYRMNLRTAVAMTRAAVPKLVDGSGSVLFVAATAVDSPPATLAAYVASKAGIVALVHSLSKELSDRSIRVNAIAPTTIDTPANREAMPDADFSSWTEPEEIARVLAWLGSGEASAVRGAVVPV